VRKLFGCSVYAATGLRPNFYDLAAQDAVINPPDRDVVGGQRSPSLLRGQTGVCGERTSGAVYARGAWRGGNGRRQQPHRQLDEELANLLVRYVPSLRGWDREVVIDIVSQVFRPAFVWLGLAYISRLCWRAVVIFFPLLGVLS